MCGHSPSCWVGTRHQGTEHLEHLVAMGAQMTPLFFQPFEFRWAAGVLYTVATEGFGLLACMA